MVLNYELCFRKENVSFKKRKISSSAIVVNSEFNGIDFNTFIEDNKIIYGQNDFLESSWNLTNPIIISLQNKIKGKNKTQETKKAKNLKTQRRTLRKPAVVIPSIASVQ